MLEQEFLNWKKNSSNYQEIPSQSEFEDLRTALGKFLEQNAEVIRPRGGIFGSAIVRITGSIATLFDEGKLAAVSRLEYQSVIGNTQEKIPIKIYTAKEATITSIDAENPYTAEITIEIGSPNVPPVDNGDIGMTYKITRSQEDCTVEYWSDTGGDRVNYLERGLYSQDVPALHELLSNLK